MTEIKIKEFKKYNSIQFILDFKMNTFGYGSSGNGHCAIVNEAYHFVPSFGPIEENPSEARSCNKHEKKGGNLENRFEKFEMMRALTYLAYFSQFRSFLLSTTQMPNLMLYLKLKS